MFSWPIKKKKKRKILEEVVKYLMIPHMMISASIWLDCEAARFTAMGDSTCQLWKLLNVFMLSSHAVHLQAQFGWAMVIARLVYCFWKWGILWSPQFHVWWSESLDKTKTKTKNSLFVFVSCIFPISLLCYRWYLNWDFVNSKPN